MVPKQKLFLNKGLLFGISSNLQTYMILFFSLESTLLPLISSVMVTVLNQTNLTSTLQMKLAMFLSVGCSVNLLFPIEMLGTIFDSTCETGTT